MPYLNRIKHAAAALLLAVTLPLAGCFEDLAPPYDGPDQLEWQQFIGQYARTVAQTSDPIQLQVNLIGPHRTSDITGSVRVVPLEEIQNAAGANIGTNAVEGENYVFPNGTTFTIPAGSSFGYVTVDPLASPNLPQGQSRRLVLEIQDIPGQNVIAAQNLKRFTVNIAGSNL